MRKWLCLLSLVSLLFFFACETGKDMSGNIRTPNPAPGASYVGSKACADCHEEIFNAMKGNVHMQLAEFEAPGFKKGCEGCHGPGSKHIDEEDPKYIITFGKENAFERSDVCLKCHTDAETYHWDDSIHARRGIACTDCHDIHNPKGEYMLKKAENELCSSCHRDIYAKFYLPNHHPLKEGKIECASCHNPHGSEVKHMVRSEERLNDLCYQCHMDKEGPFVFEHEPVSERCTICHEPHGTAADNLLKQNEPFLCLQCHEFHFHSNVEAEAGVGLGAEAMHKVFTTRCTICHYQIHGSDSPSFTISGEGKGLTR